MNDDLSALGESGTSGTAETVGATAPRSGASLSELQHWLARALRSRRSLTSDPRTAAAVARHIGGNDRYSPAEQLDVYREQFWLRHTNSLVEDFPGVGGILGQKEWEQLVEGYLGAVVPVSWSLSDLGDRFPSYIETNAGWLKQHRLCVDMARLEWAYCELFSAKDQPNLDAEKVAAMPEDAWEYATLELSDALRLIAVEYPVAQLRYDIKTRGEQEHLPLPAPSPQCLALYRKERSLFFQTLHPAPFQLLERLGAGVPLGRACAETALLHPDANVEEAIGAWFQDWAARGWIVDVKVTPAQTTSKRTRSS